MHYMPNKEIGKRSICTSMDGLKHFAKILHFTERSIELISDMLNFRVIFKDLFLFSSIYRRQIQERIKINHSLDFQQVVISISMDRTRFAKSFTRLQKGVSVYPKAWAK